MAVMARGFQLALQIEKPERAVTLGTVWVTLKHLVQIDVLEGVLCRQRLSARL